MTQYERMMAGLIYDPADPQIMLEQAAFADRLWAFNQLRPSDTAEKERYMREVFAACGIDGLLNIEVLELSAAEHLPGGGGADQPVQKEAQVPYEMEGGGLGVPRNIEHGVPQLIPLRGELGAVDGLKGVDPRAVQILLHPQPVKLQPGILPGVGLVGGVGVDLAGTDQKTLPRPQLIPAVRAVRAGGVQCPPPGDNVVKEIVVAHKGAEGVQGLAPLPAILVQPEVQKVLIGENGEGVVFHGQTLLSRWSPRPLRTISPPPALAGTLSEHYIRFFSKNPYIFRKTPKYRADFIPHRQVLYYCNSFKHRFHAARRALCTTTIVSLRC